MTNALSTQISRYIDAGFPVLYVNTFEEDKVDAAVASCAYGKEVIEWNETDCLIKTSTGGAFLVDGLPLEASLDQLKSPDILDKKIFVIKDAVAYLENPVIVSKIKGIARMIARGAVDAAVIIVATTLVIPAELEKYITILETDYPDQDEITEIIKRFISENELPPLREELMFELSSALKGMTEFELLNLLALSASSSDMGLTKRDIKLIFDQKQQMIRKAGILEMIPLKESIDDIGGLEVLKTWLKRKAKVFTNMNKASAFGVDMPKGVLIAGMPGCGKSLSAKAVANLFEAPLLRLDMGRLMGKYVGESESNMRKAIALAEAISPCILWVDELEKAFAGVTSKSGGSSEVTTRLFGYFLTWMQEKRSATFVVATANDITILPPELLRKGRFDEIFSVDLPSSKEREKIFEIHLKKRRPNDIKDIKISELASVTEGFSGADIEGVVRDSVENAFADDRPCVTTENIKSAIKATHSLSEVMKDEIEKLSKVYKERKFKNASTK